MCSMKWARNATAAERASSSVPPRYSSGVVAYDSTSKIISVTLEGWPSFTLTTNAHLLAELSGHIAADSIAKIQFVPIPAALSLWYLRDVTERNKEVRSNSITRPLSPYFDQFHVGNKNPFHVLLLNPISYRLLFYRFFQCFLLLVALL